MNWMMKRRKVDTSSSLIKDELDDEEKKVDKGDEDSSLTSKILDVKEKIEDLGEGRSVEVVASVGVLAATLENWT
jgi:hypothetical protein